MAVVNNTLSAIGDQLIIETDIITGINQINSFTDDTTGVTGTRTWSKEFRYTTDQVHWSDWQTLSNGNLSGLTLLPSYHVKLQYRYTRTGSDATGLLEFNWITLDITAAILATDELDNSIFAEFFEGGVTQAVLQWCTSVFKKLYEPGIVMLSMERGGNLGEVDRDFIDFWKSICCHFAMLVGYAREFEQFSTHEDLLRRFLENRGMFLRPYETLADMQYLMDNAYKIISQRATMGMITKEGDTFAGDTMQIDGELLRLINYNDVCDEFQFIVSNLTSNGWVLDVNSPLYKRINNVRANKLDEDINNLPLVDPGNCSIVTFDGYDDVLQTQDTTNRAGVYQATPMFNIDPNLHYELSFWARGAGALSAIVTQHDAFDNILTTQFGVQQQKFPQTDEWYYVSFIIYPVSSPIMGPIDMLFGHHMKWRQETCQASIGVFLNNAALSNTDPEAQSIAIEVAYDETRVLNLEDFLTDYYDAEGDAPESIELTSISGVGAGTLTLNDVTITVYPTTVTVQDIADGKLKYVDNNAVSGSKTVQIIYSVNAVAPSITLSDVLYIRDINFQVLKTDYDRTILNAPQLVESWIKNRSVHSNNELGQLISKYLIPYDSGLINNFL